MSNNNNNRMSQQQTMSQNQWYPNMNPYGFYGMNQFGFSGFGGPPGPFFPPGGFYPSQMTGVNGPMMNNQQNSPQMQMKGFVSGGKLESTTGGGGNKKDNNNENSGEESRNNTAEQNQNSSLGGDNQTSSTSDAAGTNNKMDIDLPPLPPGPAPPPFANFMPQTPPSPMMGMRPLLPLPPGLGNNTMNNSPMRFNNMNFNNKPRFNNNNQQQNMNNINMQGLSKKQRSKLRKRLAKEALEKQQQQQNASFQPPLPPGPPPPPGSAPPPPTQAGGSNMMQSPGGTAQHFLPASPAASLLPSPAPEKQNNYKSILNSSLMGDWPDSLRSYISRALERCHTDIDEQRVTKQLQNKITAAVNSNMLYIKDWTSEPLPLMENELSNVTIKPFQFSNKNNNLNMTSSPFHHNNRPNSSLKQRLGAMSSNSNQNQNQNRSRTKNNQQDKKYGRNSDQYGRKRKSSSSSSSSSTPGGASDTESADYIPLNSNSSSSSSKNNRKNKYESNSNHNRNNKKSRNSKRYSDAGADLNFSNVESDEALLRKRAARFNESSSSNSNSVSASRRSTNSSSFSVNFDSFDMIGRGGGGGEDGGEFDLSSCHVVGTCRDLEKQFFRLTAAPEPSMVRPPEVLEKSLTHVKQRWDQNKDIVWTTSQLKSIRQDLTVQGIRDQLTVRVYETHARIALASRQHAEFNQCQNQLRLLYSELELDPNSTPNRCEFIAYRILYYIFTKDTMDMTMTLASLSGKDKSNPVVQFALNVQSAWRLGLYNKLFTLYGAAPLSTGSAMDLFIERERKQALVKIVKAYVLITMGGYCLGSLGPRFLEERYALPGDDVT
uniref:Leukocyte receptor cluster member 8 n=1 Tax=Cacopsylla melanoneura TaxID=428564 RepID=A0A8D8ZMW9_9HEMI